nr:DUF1254 domain-containing protein [Methyloceanibacter methanicus]
MEFDDASTPRQQYLKQATMSQRRNWTTFAAAAIATVLTVTAPALAAGEPDETEQFEAIVKEAYVYAFPLLVAYQVLYDYNVDRKSGAYIAPFNTLHNEARVYTPKDTAVKTPNSDTPYSFAQLDLRVEPMVICLPAVDPKRYLDVQLTDMYTFNYGYMGSRTTGNKAGCYLVAGPKWSGKTPGGIKKVFRSETDFSLAIFRTQLFDPSDMPNVERVQAGYSVRPLSAYLGQSAPSPAPTISWPVPSKTMFGPDFPEYLNFLLQFMPGSAVPDSEKALRGRFETIGIGLRQPFDSANFSQEEQQALAAGIKAATAKIAETAETVGAKVNGWQIGAAAGDRAFFDGNWALRAAGAKLGIYGNSETEAVYPFTRTDINGVPLDGSMHNYTLTFPAGKLPPVNAFWSVTMYDGRTQLLIDNPINRYLINSPMLSDLKRNPDGSLTLYIQHDRPGKGRESNWLPAPDGPMFVVMRLYWPEATVPRSSHSGTGPGRRRGSCLSPCPRARREALRRQVARDGHPYRSALWRPSVLPGAARLAVLELPGISQADPGSQPVAGHAVYLFPHAFRLALGRDAHPAGPLSPRALLQARALQGRARHLRLDRRGSGGLGHRTRSRLDEPVRAWQLSLG